jgi:hypothetical protein
MTDTTDAKDITPKNYWPYGASDAETRRILLAWARRNNLRYSEAGRCLHWLMKAAVMAGTTADMGGIATATSMQNTTG